MAQQRSLVLIKPDGVQRGLIGTIISRFERKGLTICSMKMLQADTDLAKQHYAVHAERPFFNALVSFVTASPLVAMVIEGDEAVAVIRTLIGSTDGRSAAPGTIRGDFGCSVGANLVHASDSEENAQQEIALWFPEGVDSWERCDKAWLDAD